MLTKKIQDLTKSLTFAKDKTPDLSKPKSQKKGQKSAQNRELAYVVTPYPPENDKNGKFKKNWQ